MFSPLSSLPRQAHTSQIKSRASVVPADCRVTSGEAAIPLASVRKRPDRLLLLPGNSPVLGDQVLGPRNLFVLRLQDLYRENSKNLENPNSTSLDPKKFLEHIKRITKIRSTRLATHF